MLSSFICSQKPTLTCIWTLPSPDCSLWFDSKLMIGAVNTQVRSECWLRWSTLILRIQYFCVQSSHDRTSNSFCDFHLRWGLRQTQWTLQRFAVVHIFPAMSYVDNVFVLVWRSHEGFALHSESRPRRGPYESRRYGANDERNGSLLADARVSRVLPSHLSVSDEEINIANTFLTA